MGNIAYFCLLPHNISMGMSNPVILLIFLPTGAIYLPLGPFSPTQSDLQETSNIQWRVSAIGAVTRALGYLNFISIFDKCLQLLFFHLKIVVISAVEGVPSVALCDTGALCQGPG